MFKAGPRVQTREIERLPDVEIGLTTPNPWRPPPLPGITIPSWDWPHFQQWPYNPCDVPLLYWTAAQRMMRLMYALSEWRARQQVSTGSGFVFPPGSVPINQQSFRIQAELEWGHWAWGERRAGIQVLNGNVNRAGLVACGARWETDTPLVPSPGHGTLSRMEMFAPSRDGRAQAHLFYQFPSLNAATGVWQRWGFVRSSGIWGVDVPPDISLPPGQLHDFELVCFDDYRAQLRVNGQVVALTEPGIPADPPPHIGTGHVAMRVEVSAGRQVVTEPFRARMYMDPVAGWIDSQSFYSAATQDEFVTDFSTSTHFPATRWERGVNSLVFNESPHIIHGGGSPGDGGGGPGPSAPIDPRFPWFDLRTCMAADPVIVNLAVEWFFAQWDSLRHYGAADVPNIPRFTLRAIDMPSLTAWYSWIARAEQTVYTRIARGW